MENNYTGVAALAMLAAGIVSCAAASEWYVDNQAAGAGTGANWADAFTDFGTAVSNVWGAGANTGATIYVRQAVGAPDYAGGIEIGEGFADGAPDAYNRIVGWTGEGYAARPRLVRGNNGPLISLGAAETVARRYYEFRTLSFRGNDLWNSSSLYLCYTSGDVRFLDNVCTNASFRANDSSNNSKTNLLIQGNHFGGGSVCSFRSAQEVDILENTIIPGGVAGTSAAISLGYSNSGFLMQGNTIIGGDCISSQSTKDVIIERNRFKAGYRAAIFSDNYPERWIIRNNIFHDITGGHTSWPEGRGINIYRNPTLVIANNTFHNFPEEGAIAIALVAYVKDAIVFNNVISGASSGIVAVAGATCTNDFNVFWNVDTPHSGAAAAGAHDRTADPRFKDAAGLDFRLGNDALKFSAAKVFNGVGAPDDDYFGATRGAALSFGAIDAPALGLTLLLR